jgi:hypothetical protein
VQEKEDIEEARTQDQDELETLQENLEEVKASHAEKSKKVAEAKQHLQKKSKDIDSRLKEISNLEGTVQKNSAQKFALLRRCKLEQIQLPMSEGSLDNIPNEDVLLRKDQDAMDVDGEADEDEVMEAAMDDYGIEIDFDSLDEDLKNVSHLFCLLTHKRAKANGPQARRRPRRQAPRQNHLPHQRTRKAQPQHARHGAPRVGKIPPRIHRARL